MDKQEKQMGVSQGEHEAGNVAGRVGSRLKLERTVIRTLSGVELQRVAGGLCGGASVQTPEPPPQTGDTKCINNGTTLTRA